MLRVGRGRRTARRARRDPGRGRARRSPRADRDVPLEVVTDRLHVIVTAGPTREYIDPVRYLSNESSGTMGFAIARRAPRRRPPGDDHLGARLGRPRAPRASTWSARSTCSRRWRSTSRADAIFMAAAVGDFRPATRHEGKWKKKEEGGAGAVLELVENPDLLATIARDKGARKVIAFALETSDGERARRQARSQERGLHRPERRERPERGWEFGDRHGRGRRGLASGGLPEGRDRRAPRRPRRSMITRARTPARSTSEAQPDSRAVRSLLVVSLLVLAPQLRDDRAVERAGERDLRRRFRIVQLRAAGRRRG